MKKQLFYFENLCNKISKSLCNEETEDETEVSVTVNNEPVSDDNIDVTTETDIEEPETESVKIDNVNIDNVTVNVNIKNLKVKLQNKLADIKKKAYASRLYSTNVGNNPEALKDYGYFIGQKELLYEILKDLNDLENLLEEPEQEE